jgi:hypothetical protein
MSQTYEIVVSQTLQNDSGDQFFCNLCGFTLRTREDFRVNSEHSCCYDCYLTFVESQKEKWSTGWRPKKSVVRQYINNKKRLIINAEN